MLGLMQRLLRLSLHARLSLVAAAGIAAMAGPVPAMGQGTPSAYCDPSASAFDPLDVPAGGSGPVGRPGIRERTITVAGQTTRLLG